MSPDMRALRLPGSVGDIVASPPGPRVGAFFDLDGTLVGSVRQLYLDTLKNWPGEQAKPAGAITKAKAAKRRIAASRPNKDGAKGRP